MRRYFPLIPLMLFIAFAAPVYGYIDPGSGSVAVQAILAGFLGVLLALKIYGKKIVNFFGNLFRGGEKKDGENRP
jgi:hypothetical protein